MPLPVRSVAPVPKHPVQRVRLDRAKVAEVQAITGTRTMAEAIDLALDYYLEATRSG
jgi:Arc/MetJ family transcription regulator